MNTFLPLEEYIACAEILDYRRLGKQRIEAKQILEINYFSLNSRWRNHPAVRMWRGYEYALALYGKSMCVEWVRRGYVDNQFRFFKSIEYRILEITHSSKDLIRPKFSPELYASHRASLLWKEPMWYNKLGWLETPKLGYVWPEDNSQSA